MFLVILLVASAGTPVVLIWRDSSERRGSSRASVPGFLFAGAVGGGDAPPRTACLARSDAPVPSRLADAAPSKAFELADAHPGRVENEHGQAVAGRQQPYDGNDVLGRRRLDGATLLARQLPRQLVAGRVRLNTGVRRLLPVVQRFPKGRRVREDRS